MKVRPIKLRRPLHSVKRKLPQRHEEKRECRLFIDVFNGRNFSHPSHSFSQENLFLHVVADWVLFITSVRGRLILYARFNVHQTHVHDRSINENWVSNLELSGPGAETSPLVHRGPQAITPTAKSEVYDRLIDDTNVLMKKEEVYKSTIYFGLVILTSRFEATRGLFWDGPRNFEPRSNEENDT
ncbi:hypothetical protein AVEN_132942-1 [Araneus ventricosus]|uniref:Uncharacterized protein n=1 Tax=Araneus ventricosus TaxID=182803 RepID=A0A4Y2KP31_ARAVE|nr:hypothetical protein AVEN_132942-1 [Araneus ventricosus]